MHVNATEPGKTADAGMEVYVSKDNSRFADSKFLGSAVLQSLGKNFDVPAHLSESKTGIWVLKGNALPAILVELGYIDNKDDAANLTDDKKIEQMARKILEGTVLYANHSTHEIKMVDIKKEEAAIMEDTTAPQTNSKTIITSSTAPLYVIDGKISSKKDLDKIDPANIQSINVIKGENAKNVYGEKGINGVVEIATKNYQAAYSASLNPPKFPGGKDGWLKYLQKNLNVNLPVDNGAGVGVYKIVVSFTVDKDGTVNDVKAENDPGFGTAEEAVRIIKTGPQWIPATENNEKIKAKTKQEITFSVAAG